MKSSSIAIVILWCFVIGSAVFGAQTPPPFPPLPTAMVAMIVLLPILFFGAAALWMQHSPFYHPVLARFIDSRFGEGCLASFLTRLRPLLLFGTAAVLQGLLGLAHVARSTDAAGSFVPYLFFVSAGVGFFVAHGILYRRKMLGVYHAAAEAPAEVSRTPVRVPLGEALRLYWWALVGIALFPSAAFIGGDVFHIPFEFFMLPFFAVTFLAAWPSYSGRAPYSFWLVAMVVYMLGGGLAAALVQVIRAVTG